jgi:hypothetical protein
MCQNRVLIAVASISCRKLTCAIQDRNLLRQNAWRSYWNIARQTSRIRHSFSVYSCELESVFSPSVGYVTFADLVPSLQIAVQWLTFQHCTQGTPGSNLHPSSCYVAFVVKISEYLLFLFSKQTATRSFCHATDANYITHGFKNLH